MHVWCVTLTQPQGAAGFAPLLSADEHQRAARFFFERDRNRYIVGRGLLRTFLGRYLGVRAAWLEFSYGPHGKPSLKTEQPGQGLQFNLAHSNDLAVYAFCWDHPLGIDVEHVRPMADEDDFAEKNFSSGEATLIYSLFGEQKRNAFFTIWTCKEALFKASGAGLTQPIHQAEIGLAAGEPARLISIDGDREQAARWRLETFEPFPGYQAALAFEGQDHRIVFHPPNLSLA